MVTFSDAARERILAIMKTQEKTDCGIRVRIAGRHIEGYRHELSWVEPGGEAGDDMSVDAGGFKAYVDPLSAPLLGGTTIDYVEDASGGMSRMLPGEGLSSTTRTRSSGPIRRTAAR